MEESAFCMATPPRLYLDDRMTWTNQGRNMISLLMLSNGMGLKKFSSQHGVSGLHPSSAQVRDWIRQHTDANDRILVTPLSDWAAWNVMDDINLILRRAFLFFMLSQWEATNNRGTYP